MTDNPATLPGAPARRVLVTGAGTGIGALTAVSLAAAGHTVYASMREPTGRNTAKAEALRQQANAHPGSLSVVELDVLSEESAVKAVEQVVAEAGGLDVVVHNAGHLLVGPTEAFTAEEVLHAYDVNAVGAHRVNRAALPVMRRQESGLLVWVGSATTRIPPPFLGPYTAAKSGFDALAESIAWDVQVYGVETTIVMPGVFTQGTSHFEDATFPSDEERMRGYDRIAGSLASLGSDTERMFDGRPSPHPQIVADEIVRVVGLLEGTRPRRSMADGSDYGAEIMNGAGEELRLRLARRMGVTHLLQKA